MMSNAGFYLLNAEPQRRKSTFCGLVEDTESGQAALRAHRGSVFLSIAAWPLSVFSPYQRKSSLSLRLCVQEMINSSFGSSKTAYCRDIFLYLSATAGGDISKNFCGQIQEYVPTVVWNPVLMGFVILPKLEEVREVREVRDDSFAADFARRSIVFNF